MPNINRKENGFTFGENLIHFNLGSSLHPELVTLQDNYSRTIDHVYDQWLASDEIERDANAAIESLVNSYWRAKSLIVKKYRIV